MRPTRYRQKRPLHAVVPKGMSAALHRFRQESRRLPVAAWVKWGKTLAVGLGICALIAYGLTRLAMGWENTWLQAWDERWLLVWRDRSPLSFARSITWESPGNTVGILPVFLTLTALTAWFRQPLIAATAVAAYIGQFALLWIDWGLWNRDRPDLIANGMAAPGLHSFPSGHVMVSVTMYGLIFYLWCRASHSWVERGIAIAFGTVWLSLIAMSRLSLGAHWPSDIIAGLIIAAFWLVSVVVALERGQRIVNSNRV